MVAFYTSHYTDLELTQAREHRERRQRMADHAVHDSGVDLQRPLDPVWQAPRKILREDWYGAPLFAGLKWFSHITHNVPWNTPEQVIVRTRSIKISRILYTVAEFYEVDASELISMRRQAYLIKPRHVAYYLARSLTNRSYPEIGRHFGDKDHSTIWHGMHKVAATLAGGDRRLAREIEQLKHLLGVTGEPA